MTDAPSPDILARADLGARGPFSGPLHGQVRLFLRELIEENFEDGQSFWTERLLIERLGIARGTLRQALDELAREGVLVREAKRGSSVRKIALQSVGLIFQRANSDFCAEMIQQLAGACLERDYQLNLYPLQTGARALTARIRQQPTRERLLLMAEGSREAAQTAAGLSTSGYRVLSLDDVGRNSSLPFVTTDGARAAEMALEHLWEWGHRRIIFLNNEPAARPSVQRKIAAFEGWTSERAGASGRVVDCGNENSLGSFDCAYATMPALWDAMQHNGETALWTASDPGAWAALRWLAERGIGVPDEVSVLGYEGVKPDAFTHPPLSTVAHDFPSLAARALQVLWSDEASAWVAPQLVVRASTGMARIHRSCGTRSTA